MHSMNVDLSNFLRIVGQATETRAGLLYDVWLAFSRYIRVAVLGGKPKEAECVVYELEQMTPHLRRLLLRHPTETYIEAGTLAYFILSYHGAIGKYKKLVNALMKRFKRCYQDLESGIASPSTSPALGKCLGLSYAVYDILEEHAKNIIQSLADNCVKDPSYSTYLCTYLAFTESLYAILKQEHNKLGNACMILKSISKSGRYLDIDTISLAMIANGLAGIAKKSLDEALALTLFTKLVRLLATEGKALKLLDKVVWLKIYLALKLNGLDRIVVYKPGEYIAIKKKDLSKTVEELRKMISVLKIHTARLILSVNIFSMIFTIVSYLMNLTIMLYILPILIPAITATIVFMNQHRVEEVKAHLEQLAYNLEHLLNANTMTMGRGNA